MTPLLDPSLIRIFHPKGYAVGVGFLVDDQHAITCAHVVATALELRTYPENAPTDELTLDFPLTSPNQKLTARVVSWQIPAIGQGDVAILEITSPLPEKATPACLIQAPDLWHHTFRAFGFPKNHENGTWATGRILGTKAGGWQQIESTEKTGYFVQPGFSGGPVWDERLGGVVGMIMEAETATRAAFISPVGVLAAAYPPLAEKIEQIISSTSDAPAPGEPPFKGLLYFDVQDAPIFFGREALTQELATRLLPSPDGRGAGGEGNFLAIVGASGSGKSSLARAGLIPALMADSPDWIYRVITPTAHPIKELAVTLTTDVESVTAATTLIDDLNADSRSLDIAASRFLRRQNAPHLLLVVDQFEELFTACKDPAERKTFIDNLLNAVGLHQTSESTEISNISLVLTLRADFYHHCAQYDNLRTALETHQAYIGPMTTDELRHAIEAPAYENGWNLEQGLVDVMLHDVNDEPGALPLLSHALLETWQRRKGREMTLAGYHASGGVRGAIAQTADRVYATLSSDSQRIARDIFLRLTELGEGTQDTRRRASLDELMPDATHLTDVETVLRILADARLVITERDAVEVAHETLIREWPALRSWLEESREGLRVHRHITKTAREWIDLGCDPGALYSGIRLTTALEWEKFNHNSLSELEKKFIQASQHKLEQEEKVKRQLRLLSLASQVNLETSSILDISQVINGVANTISDAMGFYHVGIYLMDENKEHAILRASSSESGKKMLAQNYKVKVGSRGIVGIVAYKGEFHLTLNVDYDPDYEFNPYLPTTQAEIALPIMVDEEIIGVLDVQSNTSELLTEEHIPILQMIVHQLGLTIRNSQLYGQAEGHLVKLQQMNEQLKNSEDRASRILNVAWMGTVASAWRHNIGNNITSIEDLVKLIRRDLQKNDHLEIVDKWLQEIEAIALDTHKIPMYPTSVEDDVESVNLYELLEDRINQFQRRKAYREIQIEAKYLIKNTTSIRASPAWLRRAIDIVIDNSVQAMATSPIKHLTISTQLKDDGVEIVFEDTGTGIPPQIVPLLFKQPIKKQIGEKGTGLGLFLAQTIVQAYGGKIGVDSTMSTGTTVVIWFPIEVNRETNELLNFLIISDKDDQRWQQIVEDTLSVIGITKICTPDEVFSIVEKQSFHLIIINALNVKSLLVILNQLSKIQPNAKFIIATATPTWKEAKEVFYAGANDYIRKSSDPNEILTVAQKALEALPIKEN